MSSFQRQLRRLPVYLLLDTSGSMQGDPIVACNEGLRIIYQELMGDPQAVDTVWISVITFNSQADQKPLTPIGDFIPPQLNADGVTAMDAALHLLVESIEGDLLLNTAQQRGDYCPLVFLLTDGQPTDMYGNPSNAYQAELNAVRNLRHSKKPTIVALGCGNDVKVQVLHEIAGQNVFLMQQVTKDLLRDYFRWISGSIAGASHAAGGNSEATFNAPSFPGIQWSPNGNP